MALNSDEYLRLRFSLLVNTGIHSNRGSDLWIREHILPHFLAIHPVFLHGLNIVIGAFVGRLIGATSIGGAF